MLYILVLITILVLWAFFPIVKTHRANVFYWSLCFVFILIAGFRYNLGIDTYRYTSEFSYFPELKNLSKNFIQASNYQLFWVLFESTIKTVFNSMYALQLFLATFVNITVFWYVKKNAIRPFLVILVYFLVFYFNLNMEILRESIPVCILLIGLELLKQKSYFKYYFLALLGFFFHQSAIILFFVPFLYLLNFQKKYMYLAAVLLIVVLSNLLIQIAINVLGSIEGTLFSFKMSYFEIDLSNRTFNTLIFLILKYIFIPLIAFLFLHQHLNSTEKKYVLVYLFFSILFIQSPIFYRLRDYFFIPFLVGFLNAIFRMQFKKVVEGWVARMVYISLLLTLSLFREYNNPKESYGYQKYLNYIPYNSVFNEDIPNERVFNYRKIDSWKN